jgi:2,4-diaminopentanoate dehydrogenase
MQKPYRVIVWAPSILGSACIREILRQPNYELVGVLGYSPDKNGKDIGTLLGLAPTGINVTTDKEAIFSLPADCVLYTAAPPFDLEAMDQDVIRLLESGKNVVSATAFFYPLYHGQSYVDKFETACRKGKVTLHGTGIDPGFVMERLAMTLTAMTSSVEHIKIQESIYLGQIPAATLEQYGFGLPPEEGLAGPANAILKRWLFVESVTYACVALFGRMPDRVEHKPVYEPAKEDISEEAIAIREGTTHFIRHIFNAILDDKPRVTIELLWYIRREDAPFEGGTDKWLIEIEGKPTSMRMTLEAKASIVRNEELNPDDPTMASYYATACILLKAIPEVCAAEPGLVFAAPSIHGIESIKGLVMRKPLGV